jgi:hypothetical protein
MTDTRCRMPVSTGNWQAISFNFEVGSEIEISPIKKNILSFAKEFLFMNNFLI